MTRQSDIRAPIGRLTFVFAKTMPHLPHEYTLRDRAADPADYLILYETIMREGLIHWWRRRHGRYLYPGDGWVYWSMSSKRSDAEARHPLWISPSHQPNAVSQTRSRQELLARDAGRDRSTITWSTRPILR